MLDDYRNHPDSMALLMKQYLLESVDTLPALVGMIVSGGRLNVYKAVQKVLAYDCTLPSTAANTVADKAEDVQLYPNPVTRMLNISSTFPVRQVDIYDLLGQLVHTYRNVTEIDLSGFPGGLYTLRLIDEQQRCFVRKIIVDRDR